MDTELLQNSSRIAWQRNFSLSVRSESSFFLLFLFSFYFFLYFLVLLLSMSHFEGVCTDSSVFFSSASLSPVGPF